MKIKMNGVTGKVEERKGQQMKRRFQIFWIFSLCFTVSYSHSATYGNARSAVSGPCQTAFENGGPKSFVKTEEKDHFWRGLKSRQIEEQYKLGIKHLRQGNRKKALKWLIYAANNGHLEAQHLLGQLYFFGSEEIRLKPNFLKANKWLTLALEEGHDPTKVFLIELYQNYNGKEPGMPEYSAIITWLGTQFSNGGKLFSATL